jgi:TolB-like protein/DNA-binding winged helix-turn-helix (wHTH) protein
MVSHPVSLGSSQVENDYRLGDWLVRPQRGSIEHAGQVVHLKPKVMAVLNCLAGSGGAVVTRDHIFDKVWPGQVVSDAALTQCVVELRHAFDDSAKNPQVVETIPKVGFRLIPAVEAIEDKAASKVAGSTIAGLARGKKTRTGLLAGILVVLVAMLGWQLVGPVDKAVDRSHGPETSLAVLPFTDVSPDQQQGWIAESLTEQLINRLSRLEGLEVPGKAMSFTLEKGQADLKAVARELGVDFIVEGSVFRVEEDVRITTRLVEVSSGEIWWSYEWGARLQEFLDMQELIAEGVAHALSINLDVGELGLDPLGPSDVEAFWSLERAIQLVMEDTRESWVEAVREIETATGRDANYAQAWLWASFIYSMAYARIDDILHRNWQQLSESALDRHFELAPDSLEGLNLLIQLYTDSRQYGQADRMIQRLGPLESVSHPGLLFRVGIFLSHVGRAREARQALERAQLLDPNQFAHFMRMLGWSLLQNDRPDEALAMFDRAWGTDDVLRSIGSSEGLQAALVGGNLPVIRKWLIRAQEFHERGMLRFYRAMEEHLDDPLAALTFLRQAFDQPYEDVHDHHIAIWAAYHGDNQLALNALLRANQDWWLWYPLFAPIRNDPATRGMIDELGLVEYWREYTWSDFCRPLGGAEFTCD